jgi:uncharacterized membrane protein YqjE
VPESNDNRFLGGAMGAVGQVAATAIAMVRTRIELACVEFVEARQYVQQMVVLGAIGTVLGLFALFFASLFIIVCFWDSYRLAAVGGVTLFYAIVTAVIFVRLRKLSRDTPAPFSATLEELENDVAALRRPS